MKKGTVKERRTARINSRPVRKSCTGRPPRLYLRAVFSGFRRGKTTQNENQALLRIEGVNDRKETPFYQGKRVVYVYRTSNGFRSIWGRVMKPHGNNGVVRASFRSNLPPRAIGSTLRVMLYPNRAQ